MAELVRLRAQLHRMHLDKADMLEELAGALRQIVGLEQMLLREKASATPP